MGIFVNPDNSAFQRALNSKIYVDKTGLLEEMNSVIDTEQCCICNSRPRRFGKSITANMLTAYYSCGCDSEQLFEGKKISQTEQFREHLNQYDVIHLDVQWCCMDAGSGEETVSYIIQKVLEELRVEFSQVSLLEQTTLGGALAQITQETGRKFIIIIDEWDALIRDEASNIRVQEEYIDFLRGLFKGTEPTKFLHLAFLTGILPIKKVKTQSALNNFEEFTMLEPDMLSSYIGFTEEEVKELCNCYHRDFDEVKRWYDGYMLGKYHVYNPKAVVSIMTRGVFRSYWSQTGTYESILALINMDFDGLRTAVIQMLSGTAVEVNVNTFQNDMVSFKKKDDVITLLIHLGYLAYDWKKKASYIPNEEIRQEFLAATQEQKWNELIRFQQESKALLDATLDMDGEAVAEKIEKIHTQFASTIQYHDENSLSSVLTIAYLSAMQYYFMPIREMPTGRGFADYVFLPKPEYIGDIPALLVELKWNKKAVTALQQIRDKKYVQAVSEYTGNILLVVIAYDKKSKEHECVIEECRV
ncbi:MAG TPA: ATP-binding protein [Candidatus Blautia stercoravium]|nr:ATP-binding protein [Candidatus Blautia stercoravium]